MGAILKTPLTFQPSEDFLLPFVLLSTDNGLFTSPFSLNSWLISGVISQPTALKIIPSWLLSTFLPQVGPYFCLPLHYLWLNFLFSNSDTQEAKDAYHIPFRWVVLKVWSADLQRSLRCFQEICEVKMIFITVLRHCLIHCVAVCTDGIRWMTP